MEIMRIIHHWMNRLMEITISHFQYHKLHSKLIIVIDDRAGKTFKQKNNLFIEIFGFLARVHRRKNVVDQGELTNSQVYLSILHLDCTNEIHSPINPLKPMKLHHHHQQQPNSQIPLS